MLPTLPFHVLRALFSSTPLTTDDGVLLRRMALEIGAIHLILACLSALSHHAPRNPHASTSVSEVWFTTHTNTVMILKSPSLLLILMSALTAADIQLSRWGDQ